MDHSKEEKLSYEELVRQLDYNYLTGIFIWKIAKRGHKAGSLNEDGYIHIWIDNESYKAHRLAWFYYYGYWPKDEIDHIIWY